MLNNGDEAWPAGCYLSCTGHAPNQPKPPNAIVDVVAPGVPAILTAQQCSNDAAGEYRTQWQLCTSNGSVFGDQLWCTYAVAEGPPGDGAAAVAVADATSSTSSSAMAVAGPVMGPIPMPMGPAMLEEMASSSQQQQQPEDAEMC